MAGNLLGMSQWAEKNYVVYEQKILPPGVVCQVYWYISQISGERLQDHWSSGSLADLNKICTKKFGLIRPLLWMVFFVDCCVLV